MRRQGRPWKNNTHSLTGNTPCRTAQRRRRGSLSKRPAKRPRAPMPLLGLPRWGRRPVGERTDNHRREPGKRSVSGGPLRRTGAAFQPPGHRPGRPDNGSGHRLRPGRYGVLPVRRMQAGNAGHDAATGYPLPHHYEQRAERHGRGQSRLPDAFPFRPLTGPRKRTDDNALKPIYGKRYFHGRILRRGHPLRGQPPHRRQQTGRTARAERHGGRTGPSKR